MKNKTLSIVTICKNSSYTIERLLNSVRNNLNSINEFIIIDGNSNDNTLEIINKNIDIVTILISENDNGISDAFNKGINLCKSDFILLVNSDDFLLDFNLSNLINEIEPSDNLIATPLLMKSKFGFDTYKSNYNNLNKFSSVYHPGLVISKNTYNLIGQYSLEYKIAMDYEFICRAKINNMNFRYINTPIVVFSEGGISNKNYLNSIFESYKIRNKYFNIIFPSYELLKIFLKVIGILSSYLKVNIYFTRFKVNIYKYIFE
jgi:glycosyltransferase involved in cell wall biosynthesis